MSGTDCILSRICNYLLDFQGLRVLLNKEKKYKSATQVKQYSSNPAGLNKNSTQCIAAEPEIYIHFIKEKN